MKRNDTATPGARTYVPAVIDQPKTQTSDSVLAKWVDNAGAAIGVFAVVVGLRVLAQIIGAAVGLAASQLPSLDSVQLWAAIGAVLGVIVFGVLMVLRSAMDELVQYNEWSAMQQELEERDAEVAELEDELAAMRQRYANAIEDLAETRRSLHGAMAQAAQRYRAPEQPAEPAVQRDAKFLIGLAYRGSKWSRDHVVRTYADWTPTRWTDARNLLEQAGIVRTVANRTELLYADESTAVAALAAFSHLPESQSVSV